MRGILRKLPWPAALLAIALGALPACKSGGQKATATSAPVSPASVSIDTGGRKVVFRVEVAVTPEEHARGLMYRSELATDAGMIFVFDEPSVQRFWMKNTLIPLDMIFIGQDRKIVGIVEDAAPETESERMVGAPSQYVLEIGGGLSARLGIKRGEPVELQNVPQP
ncbi:MAG TPA: DUF192 domain-containing protein [Polyangia bacterium]|nr:DUF192 domain-containing protein [Polyangia bacterium]